MKNILAVLALLLAAAGLEAQTEKGRIAIGLQSFNPLILSELPGLAPSNALGISIGKIKADDGYGGEEEENYTSLGLETNAHFFLADNFSAGINLGVFTQSYEESTTTMFMVGPELRYYFPIKDRLKIYPRFGAAWGILDGGDGEATKLSQYDGGARFAVFLANNFSLDLGLGYGTWIAKEEYEDYFTGETTELTLSTNGINLDIGFTFFFGGADE